MATDRNLWAAARGRVMVDIDVLNREADSIRRMRSQQGYSELLPKTPENLARARKRSALIQELNEMTNAMIAGEDYLIWKLSRTG